MSLEHSNNLRQYREEIGLRQFDVAERLGFVSTERISRWEQGESMPSVVNLFKLAALFGVKPDDLYSQLWEEVRTSHTPSVDGR